MNKILVIGPLPNPITGESLANKVLIENLSKNKDCHVGFINTAFKELKEDLGVFSIKKVLYYSLLFFRLPKIILFNKIYITIGQTFWGVIRYYPFILVSKILRKEVTIHVHGNNIHRVYSTLRGIKRIVFTHVLRLTDKGIVLSNSLRKNLDWFLPLDRVFVVNNFVEDYFFENIKPKKQACLRIIYLSNLMREKGILDLMSALTILKEKGIPYEARIAGGIDLKVKKEILALFNELGNNVLYEGLVFAEEKRDLLNWGNVFVFPTYYKIEGQPISLLEAMATGCIILTTRHGGIPDIFMENKNGLYIQKRNPQSIAERLQEIYSNFNLFSHISIHNKEEALQKYRVQLFVSRIRDVINC